MNKAIKEELEVLMAMGKTCEIEFRDGSGSKLSIKDRILNVFGEGNKGFLQIASGLVIDMDELVSVDGKEVSSLT